MKKTICFILLFSALLLYGCGGNINNDASAKLILEEEIKALSLTRSSEMFCSEEYDDVYLLDDDILNGKYGELMEYPELESLTKYAVYFSDELYDAEFGIFLVTTDEAATELKAYIRNRIMRMKDNAVNYPSVDISLIENYVIGQIGNWVYYGATGDNASFEETLKNIING